MRNRGYLANLEAGLLADDNTEVTPVVDGESVLEEISNGCEDIIPDGYTEIDGEMTVTENLTAAVEEEEVIMEEVELPMVEAGAESDFNANVLKMLAASNRRLNNMMGVDEKRGAPVAALESDVYGGYKKAFMAGLEAKEGFLKNLKVKAASAWKVLMETLRKWIQKAVVFFNGAKSSAEKITKVLKGKSNDTVEAGDKLTDADKKAIANKFGVWISLGGTTSDYYNYANELLNPAVPEAGKKVPLRQAKLSDSDVKELKLEKTEKWSILNLSGNTGKFLVASAGNTTNGLTAGVKAILGDEFDKLEIRYIKATIEAKDIKETETPGLTELIKMSDEVTTMASFLKSAANENYTAAESYSKAIKGLKEDETAKGAALEKIGGIAMRCALENVAAYMTAMKTMLWYSSTFAKRYKDKK